MKNLYIALLFTFALTKCFSQASSSFIPKINNIPSSPEAALLGRFGDIPVGYYTGTANISVPLYTIEESGVQIPIELSYQSSGIKVTDEATWVGLGWSLEPGGTILQEVRGIKDAYDLNLSTDPAAYTAFKTRFSELEPTIEYKLVKQKGLYLYNLCSQGSYPASDWDDNPNIINRLLAGDAQPDLYHYNFAGYSGTFYKNPETQEFVFIKQSAKISITSSGGGFMATTPQGHKFYFLGADSESAYSADPSENYAGITYKLSSIEFTNGKAITFTYASEHLSTRTYNQNATMNYKCINPPVPNEPVTFGNINRDTKRLVSIAYDGTIINFNAGSRNDINVYYNDTGKKLESIDVKSSITGKKIKTFLFGYNYFDSTPSTGNAVYDKRLKLESVKELGYSVNETADYTKPGYVFTYDTTISMPPKTSYAYDFWGYNNGQTSNPGLLPDLDYFNYPYNSEYIEIGQTLPFVYTYIPNNRYTDNNKVGALMLKRIQYPTGGYTEFTFEPHTFINQFIPNNADIVASRKQQWREQDACCINGNFNGQLSITQSTLIHFNNTFDHGHPITSDGTPDTAVISNIYQNAYIKLQKTVGTTTTDIKTWLPSDYYQGVNNFSAGILNVPTTQDLWVEYTPGATYKIVVSFPTTGYNYPNAHAAKTYSQVDYFDKSLNGNVSKTGGLRIKSIKNYTSSGVIASNKEMRYINEDGTSSGKILNKFHPLAVLEGYCNICLANSDSSAKFNQIQLSADDFGTSGGNLIGYSRVEEVELAYDNVDNIGKKVYSYNNLENNTKRGFPNILKPKNGLLEKEQVFSKAAVKLSETIYTYVSTVPETVFEGIKIRNRSFGNGDAGDGIPDEEVDNWPFPSGDWQPILGYDAYKFGYETYQMKSYWYQPLSIVTKEFFNGVEIASTQSMTYNALGQKSTQLSSMATGETMTTKYFYPGEVSGAPASEAQMVAARMIGIPVVVEQYKGTELLSKQNTEYISDSSTGSHLLPKFIFYKKGDASGPAISEKRITFDMYDNLGNLLQYTLENGTPVTYLWGYNNTSVVATIQNATYSSINSTLRDAAKNTTLEAQLLSVLSSLRATLPNAMVTTYTYKPGIGVSTITDPKGNKTSFEYDSFGRLKYVKDENGNLLSENEYNFRP